jgi:ferredoxin
MQEKKNPMYVRVPFEDLNLSGLDEAEHLELHTRNDAVVLMKKEMTAVELLSAIESLTDLSMELLVHLASACGKCDGCEGNCPFGETGDIRLPRYLLDEADIPVDAKLQAVPDPETGTITIREEESRPDLNDVSPDLLSMLMESGVCMGSLDELLASDEIIYGRR